jgi:N-formylglutamate amidohydrolase
LSPFEVIPPTADAAPLVAHVPHASTTIPVDVREELLLAEDELAAELLRLTDRYTDELFAGLADLGATLFVNRLSRLVFDPERFLDDALEPAAALGQGVVYTHGSQGQPLRRPDPTLRSRRIDDLYLPYHAALDGVVAAAVATFGSATLIDGHSFPTTPLPTEIEQSAERPDICIGTDPWHTPESLAERLSVAFTAEGFDVQRDAPYAGTFVPTGAYRTDSRVHSVMIEVRRGIYMDEANGERTGALPEVASAISRAVAAALES